MTTTRTTTTGITSRHMVETDAYERCLIADKELQQSVCPSVVPCSLLVVLLLIGLGAAALQPNQVFKRYGSCPDFLCKGNQSLAGDMENVLRYGFFSSAQPLQQAVSGTSANAGYLRSGLSKTQAAVVQLPATNVQGLVGLGVYGNEDVLLSSVYPDYSSCGLGFCQFNFNRKIKIPLPLDAIQLGVRPRAFGEWSGLEGNEFTPNTHALLSDIEVPLPAQGDGGFLVGSQTPLAIGLHAAIGGDYMAEQGTGQLGWQMELRPDRSVELFGQVVGVVGCFSIEDDIG